MAVKKGEDQEDLHFDRESNARISLSRLSRKGAGMKVEIVTPVIPPAIGGGAVYTMLLSKELLRLSENIQIRVVSERFPGTPHLTTAAGGRLIIDRLFPFRAGRSTKTASSYVSYAAAQAAYLHLARSIRIRKPQVCLLHSSLLNSPNVLVQALRLLGSSGGGTRFVLDVRDSSMPNLSDSARAFFSAVIYCSRRLEPVVRERAGSHITRNYIPIPITIELPSSEAVRASLEKYDLANTSYIFCPNNLDKEKNTGLLIESFIKVRRTHPTLRLVLAGRERYRDEKLEEGRRKGQIKVLGTIPHEDVLCLMRAAALIVNPSTIENPSRTALEALAMSCPSLLPPGVPEFDTLERSIISDVRSPHHLASQISTALENFPGKKLYPIELHASDSVAASYLEFFRNICAKDAVPK